ncbi:helix-turn-helix domain-containing protein [Atopomonas sediminilitoris]|uniref:helix-turn-helix domain-containing protein n=1 Tax=Atopomonas sediminilitoris TaxID=2919919 RepID=UPI001F4DF7BD|nr:AraC family transcriptional regulator [Atopomonas sediminilitoris]MCJ8168584.1 AraC family transcriptional regulator [Atopomonas sediminilitoris]
MFTARLLPLPHETDQHAHSHHQLVLAIHGRAEFELAGRGGCVSEQGACVVPGGVRHVFAGQGENRMLILDQSADSAEHNEASDADRTMLEQLFAEPTFAPLDPAFSQLKSYAASELQRYGHDRHLARALGGMLLRALHVRLFGEAQRQERASRVDMLHLQRYVKRHLRRRISVAELAEEAHVSAAHFHALFKQASGLTPYQFVLQQRLSEAQSLLQHSGLSLLQIAEACGFANQAALSTAMRRYLGLSPKHLR